MIKLLTVDDELDVCDFIKDFFSQRGYTVLAALNGKDAVSVVKKEKPSIVFPKRGTATIFPIAL